MSHVSVRTAGHKLTLRRDKTNISAQTKASVDEDAESKKRNNVGYNGRAITTPRWANIASPKLP
jgi:hypothetical protein